MRFYQTFHGSGCVRRSPKLRWSNRVGEGVFQSSRVGSGRVESDHEVFTLTGRVGSGRVVSGSSRIIKKFTLSGRVRIESGQRFFHSHGSDRVIIMFFTLAGRIVLGRVRVESSRVFSHSHGSDRIGSGREGQPDPIRPDPIRSDPTREKSLGLFHPVRKCQDRFGVLVFAIKESVHDCA